jgi:CubicO group peptidase (beta-lactamase class C family)
MLKFRGRGAVGAVAAVVLMGAAVAVMPIAPASAQRATPAASPLPKAAPETVGLSSARLKRIGDALAKEATDKKLPGSVVMVARKGRLVYTHVAGGQDPTGKTPMQADSIFRIYSMTKPFVSVAAMMLVEDGTLMLTDPVAKHLPAFKDVKVSTGTAEVAADRPMLVHDLLRHTAGLPYGEITKNAAVKDALAKAGIYKQGVIDFDARDLSGADQVAKLGTIPLVNQPGTMFEYSLASDVLGRVVEAVSGKRLGDFLDERLFKPLKMVDTAFWVPAAKSARVAEPFDKDPATGTPNKVIDVSKQPGNDSGGAGAVSTAADYLRFAQMMGNGGTLDGVRVLSRSTVKLMTSDHLGSIAAPLQPGELLMGVKGYTFGLGFMVRQGDGIAGVPGSAGEFMWAGYGGTFFWVDPKEQLTVVYMTQAPSPARAHYRRLMKQLVAQAMVD